MFDSSVNSSPDITDALIGSAIPSLMLYHAKKSTTDFASVALKDCSFSLFRREHSALVDLSIAVKPKEEVTISSEKLNLTCTVDLSDSPPILIGDQDLSVYQITLLKRLAGLKHQEVIANDEVKLIPVESISFEHFIELTNSEQRCRVHGSMEIDRGQSIALDAYISNVTSKIVMRGYCLSSNSIATTQLRSLKDIQGYLLNVEGDDRTIAIQGFNARQAQGFILSLEHLIRSEGLESGLRSIKRLIAASRSDPSTWLGDIQPPLGDSTNLLHATEETISNCLRTQGDGDFYGYIKINNSNLRRYSDVKFWIPEPGRTADRVTGIILRAYSTERSQAFEAPNHPGETSGYVLQILPDYLTFSLEDYSRDEAVSVLTRVLASYRSVGLVATVKIIQQLIKRQ